MKFFWSLPGIAVYVYIVTILTEAGFISYFNVPTYFVEVSVRDNTVYFYNLLNSIWEVVRSTHWYYLVGIGLVIAVFICTHYLIPRSRKLIVAIPIFLLLIFAWNSYNFGRVMAQNQTYYLTLGADCPTIATSTTYIIPAVHDDRAILVPIDSETHKMAGGFLVKDPVELGCTLQYKTVGAVGS